MAQIQHDYPERSDNPVEGVVLTPGNVSLIRAGAKKLYIYLKT